MTYTAEQAAAMQHRRGEAGQLATDPNVLRLARAALDVNPRPVQVVHAGHPAGLVAAVAVESDDEGPGGSLLTVNVTPARRDPGTVASPPAIGGAWTLTCSKCGKASRVSAVRLLRDALAAVVARSGGNTGPTSRVRLR